MSLEVYPRTGAAPDLEPPHAGFARIGATRGGLENV
jgi:hypothetical protein